MTTLVTNVVGRSISPRPGLDNAWPSTLQRELDGRRSAKIVAAWVEGGSLRIVVHDHNGNVGMTWIECVILGG